MKILSIETSCDDTGIAILETKGSEKSPDFDVLSNIVSSQIEVHKKYGGVFPAMAKREHQRNLLPTLLTALRESGSLKIFNSQFSISNKFSMTKFSNIETILKREPELAKKIIPFLQKYAKPDIDLIAVTNGPGLEPCLWVGVNFAKALSYFWNIPVVSVNHIESHILVNYLNKEKINFPALALVVSGGHTQLILAKGIGKYKILGETRDDAAGECFDKCAKTLGLGYPGGPEIAKLAAEARPPRARGGRASVNLPRPMINTKDYDFSFSGLKTAVLYSWRKLNDNGVFFVSRQKTHQLKIEAAAEIQQAIIDVLIKKTIKAAKNYKVKTIILGGGVSANKELKKQFAEKIEKELPNTEFLFPQTDHSTDNGLMTAITGYFHRTKKISWKNLYADANLRISK